MQRLRMNIVSKQLETNRQWILTRPGYHQKSDSGIPLIKSTNAIGKTITSGNDDKATFLDYLQER